VSVPEIFGMAAGGFTLAFVRLIANWSMSRSETTPPNSVGRLSSLAAIRELTAAVELADCYLGAAPMLGDIAPSVLLLPAG
jgi:hypothetical protein